MCHYCASNQQNLPTRRGVLQGRFLMSRFDTGFWANEMYVVGIVSNDSIVVYATTPGCLYSGLRLIRKSFTWQVLPSVIHELTISHNCTWHSKSSFVPNLGLFGATNDQLCGPIGTIVVYVCMCACMYVCIYLSIYPSIHPSIHLCLSVCMYVCIWMYMYPDFPHKSKKPETKIEHIRFPAFTGPK